jgi:biopolymer transport protein TolQ
MSLIASTGFQYALETTSTPGLVVVAALALLSVLTWTILLTRWLVVSRARRRNERYLDAYGATSRPLDLFLQGGVVRGAPMFAVYSAACRELCLQLLGTTERSENFAMRIHQANRLQPTQTASIQLAMDRAIGEMALRLEARMNLLATCVSGAPFLGLLGTVWGVMDTFAAVAGASGGASLQDMAPGVSAALVTTVVGLLIAIPAMFGYNLLIQAIKTTVMHLDHHAAELATAIERFHVDHRPAPPRAPASDTADEPARSGAGEPADEPPPARPAGPMFPGQSRLPFENDEP